jgi:hypothetical protein
VAAPLGSGGGSGSISVTDGTTTVNPATSLTLTGATVTDAGGGEADVAISSSPGGGITLLGPFAVAYTDAGINTNTEGGVGKVLAAIPAGTIVLRAWMATTTDWTTDKGHPAAAVGLAAGSDEWDIVNYTDTGGSLVTIGDANMQLETDQAAWHTPPPPILTTSQLAAPTVAVVDCHLVFSALDKLDPTGVTLSGAGVVYAVTIP